MNYSIFQNENTKQFDVYLCDFHAFTCTTAEKAKFWADAFVDKIEEQMLEELHDFDETVDHTKVRMITKALILADGNKAEAAKLLGIKRTRLLGMLQKFKIESVIGG